MVCGILVPWPGIEPGPPAFKAWSLSHWTTREVPDIVLNFSLLLFSLLSVCMLLSSCFIWVLSLSVIITPRPQFLITHLALLVHLFSSGTLYSMLCSSTLCPCQMHFLTSTEPCFSFAPLGHVLTLLQLWWSRSRAITLSGFWGLLLDREQIVLRDSKGWNKNDYQNILSFWPVLIFLYWIVMTLWHKTPLGWGKVGRETSDINEKNWAEYLLFLLHLIRLNINDYWWGL